LIEKEEYYLRAKEQLFAWRTRIQNYNDGARLPGIDVMSLQDLAGEAALQCREAKEPVSVPAQGELHNPIAQSAYPVI
jgi:hypothetical protein